MFSPGEFKRRNRVCIKCNKERYHSRKDYYCLSDKEPGWAWRDFIFSHEKIAEMRDKGLVS
jgi:hypothetical protein